MLSRAAAATVADELWMLYNINWRATRGKVWGSPSRDECSVDTASNTVCVCVTLLSRAASYRSDGSDDDDDEECSRYSFIQDEISSASHLFQRGEQHCYSVIPLNRIIITFRTCWWPRDREGSLNIPLRAHFIEYICLRVLLWIKNKKQQRGMNNFALTLIAIIRPIIA